MPVFDQRQAIPTAEDGTADGVDVRLGGQPSDDAAANAPVASPLVEIGPDKAVSVAFGQQDIPSRGAIDASPAPGAIDSASRHSGSPGTRSAAWCWLTKTVRPAARPRSVSNETGRPAARPRSVSHAKRTVSARFLACADTRLTRGLTGLCRSDQRQVPNKGKDFRRM